MSRSIYLDHAATTPMRPEVWEAMAPYATEVFGNASGSHAVSRRAKTALEEARERAAVVVGCAAKEIVFTAGGTESDNLAVKGRFEFGSRPHLVASTVEHEAVTESVQRCVEDGGQATWIAVDSFGRVDPTEVAAAVSDHTAVVSVMMANNETGTIQPIADVVEAVGGRAPVHTDAVQAFSTEDVDVSALGVDLLSLAAHKFGGPKGMGLLYVRDGVELRPVLDGGGQELGRRSGTSNVMGAVGMATAMEVAAQHRASTAARIAAVRRLFERELADVAVRTVPSDRALESHSHLRFAGNRNETMLVRLDREGVAVSVGSACSSGAAMVSHVLTAMGMAPAEARQCLRFSFGWSSTESEAREAASIIKTVVS